MSAIEQPVYQTTFRGGADFTAEPVGSDETNRGMFRCVRMNSSERLILATASSQSPIGVLQRKSRLGEPTTVMILGITKVVFGAAGLAVGSQVVAGANGKVVAAHATNNQYVMGTVVKSAGVNEIGSILLHIRKQAGN